MPSFDNGGANAIKGFNYQKSVVILIAVLNYMRENNFELYVESEDDIVVRIDGTKTYIQAKSQPLSVATILRRKDGKDSILEKNISNGSESDSMYKLVTPSFKIADKHLVGSTPIFITDGASLHTYSEVSLKKIKETYPALSDIKLKNSKVALTDFGANQKQSLTYIKGVMVNQGIAVDQGIGLATLHELSNQIDQRSELTISTPEDYEKKKFNSTNLQNIFIHSRKLALYEELLISLNYSTGRKVEMRNKNKTIGAIYETHIERAKKITRRLQTATMDDIAVIEEILKNMSFSNDVSDLDRNAIAVNAYSQVLFEKES